MKAAKVPYPVGFIAQKLQSAGFEVYVVGGAVRDLLLGKKQIFDWDFTTNATPEQVQPLFEGSFYDNNFGTVMVAPKHVMEQAGREFLYEELTVFDITTYRSESGYSDRRRPDEVKWGEKLSEDLKRRDFTINALALEFALGDGQLQPSEYLDLEGRLVDEFGGEDDLNNKLIRAVGDADERFKEDALRMMRAIRIASELSFRIDSVTFEALKQNVDLIAHVSAERIRDELLRIIESDHPASGIQLMSASGLLKYVLPELLEAKGVPQGGHHIYDVWKHMIESLRECPSRDPIVRLATLLHDVGKPRTMKKQGPRGVTFYGHEVVGARMAEKIAQRLKFSNKQKKRLYTLVRWHMFTYDPKMSDAAIRRFIRRVGVENINDMMMLRVGDRKGGGSKATSWRLRELQKRIGENLYEPMSVGDLEVDGIAVMKLLEIEPSKLVGEVLNELFELVMEGTIPNEKEILEKEILEICQKKLG